MISLEDLETFFGRIEFISVVAPNDKSDKREANPGARAANSLNPVQIVKESKLYPHQPLDDQ